MRVCEFEIKCCPYCEKTEKFLKEIPRGDIPNTHMIHCISCNETFYVPCED